jgi:hypothetical protein
VPAAAASANGVSPKERSDTVTPEYAARRPTETVLYGIVRDHLETFLAHARETYDRGLPKYVEHAFRAYLECGVFAHGFIRFHCDGCRRDLLVAFSCQGRGVCPSCAARRMANSAAHHVDRILPAVPLRQYVLSLPFELRRLAAFRADVARALGRIFIDAVAFEQKREAGPAGSQHLVANHLQRFGGSLNLNLHYHAIVADGVFAKDADGRVHFHGLAPPSEELLDRVVLRVRDRALRWLRKHRILDDRPAEDRGNETPERGALDACGDIALRGGALTNLDGRQAKGVRGERGEQDDDARFETRPRGSFTAELDGFNLHAAVRIEARDDVGRERLVRYCARPCFALDRLSVLADGRVAYRVKYAGRRGTHRVMTPIEFLARLAALVAPPRYPLVRYHGVIAPHSKWRSAVVPKPPPKARTHDHPTEPAASNGTAAPKATTPPKAVPSRAASQGAPPAAAAGPLATMSSGAGGVASVAAATSSSARAAAGVAAVLPLPAGVEITDVGISVRHLDRLLGGLLLATAPRLDWAKLLRRTFAIDALRCGHCGGRLRLLAAITKPASLCFPPSHRSGP